MLDLAADTIDVREMTERFDRIEDSEDPEEIEEVDELNTLLSALRGEGGDEQWRGEWYPLLLIADWHFEDYAREFAEDIGRVSDGWPTSHMDWAAAVYDLQQDYTSIEVRGTIYWYR